MVTVNIFGNARAHKLSYGRGVRQVSKEIAYRLVKLNVAHIVDEPKPADSADMKPVETATEQKPIELETATVDIPKAADKPKSKAKSKPNKKK